MSRQKHREVAFDVPDPWQDQTVAVWTAPTEPGKPAKASIVITRDKLVPGQTVKTYAVKQIAAVSKSLHGLEIEETRDINVSGLAAVELRFTWENEGGQVAQRQMLVAHGDSVYSITATCPKKELAQHSPTLDAILASVRLLPGVSDDAPVLERNPRATRPF